MTDKNLRWQQRFASFERALARLEQACELAGQRQLSQLEQQGLIKVFEFNQELAWRVMKDYLQHQGLDAIIGSRDAIRIAFQNALITDGERWMETIASRNISSHTYDEASMEDLTIKIIEHYLAIFIQFRERMRALTEA